MVEHLLQLYKLMREYEKTGDTIQVTFLSGGNGHISVGMRSESPGFDHIDEAISIVTGLLPKTDDSVAENPSDKVLRLIRELTANEGDSVTIFHPNADFGSPSETIMVSKSWGEGQERQYFGESLLECLEKASGVRDDLTYAIGFLPGMSSRGMLAGPTSHLDEMLNEAGQWNAYIIEFKRSDASMTERPIYRWDMRLLQWVKEKGSQ